MAVDVFLLHYERSRSELRFNMTMQICHLKRKVVFCNDQKKEVNSIESRGFALRTDQKMNRTRKRAISIKMFLTEFGENFPDNVKERMMALESRCYLTRKEIPYQFDLKHVEHLQYECAANEAHSPARRSKEYAYGQFVVLEGQLYFSECCVESNEIMQSPMVSIIFNDLSSEGIISIDGRNLKKLTGENIDLVVDKILSSCPQVSQAYRNIIKETEAQTYKS